MNTNKSLTEKQKRFCEEYIIDLNGAMAAIRTGYSEKTAKEQASRLLTNVNVQEYIQCLKVERSKRTAITADMVIEELAKIGFSNIANYMKVIDREITLSKDNGHDGEEGEDNDLPETDGSSIVVRDVEVFKTDDVGIENMAAVAEIRRSKDGISIKLHDKVKALESLGKHTGIYEKNNAQKKPIIRIGYGDDGDGQD